MKIDQSPTVAIARDLVQSLVDTGVGAWNSQGVYSNGQYGFVIGALPRELSQVIGLTPYAVSTDTEPGVDTQGFQFRIRTGSADPNPAIGIADMLLERLHGVEGLRLGGFNIPLIWRNSLADLGLDEAGRYEITDNYYMYVDRRSA